MLIKAVAGAEMHRLVELLEMQGGFAIPPVMRAEAQEKNEGSVPLGTLSIDGRKCALRVESLLIEGDSAPAKKSLLVLCESNTVETASDDGGAVMKDGLLEEVVGECPPMGSEYAVCHGYGVLQHRYLFKLKPLRVFQ